MRSGPEVTVGKGLLGKGDNCVLISSHRPVFHRSLLSKLHVGHRKTFDATKEQEWIVAKPQRQSTGLGARAGCVQFDWHVPN